MIVENLIEIDLAIGLQYDFKSITKQNWALVSVSFWYTFRIAC